MDTGDKRYRLLIVDDEEEFLISSSRALSRRGFIVDAALNGVTALDKVEEFEYDAVVLDVKMPDIDGIEVFYQIRRIHPDLPVILLTGHSSIGDAFQTSKEGIADYLSKPIEMDELAGKINLAISSAKKSKIPDDGNLQFVDREEPIRVMIVDDEVEFLDSMKPIFERRKFMVKTAVDGKEALESLREELVDVVVLDVKMPGMDGLEVLRYIKKDFPSVDVILLSGHPSIEAAVEGVRLGASEYLKKPPNIDGLVETIRRFHFEQRRAYIQRQQRLIDEIQNRYPE
jgi:DNA-binding NtrC family response regulator